jgi:hypothetical protein
MIAYASLIQVKVLKVARAKQDIILGSRSRRRTREVGMDLHDKITEFLRSQKGGRFCDECILKEVGADLGDVPKETASLENLVGFLPIKRGICTRCQASKDHLMTL